jgi:hypothetical protein
VFLDKPYSSANHRIRAANLHTSFTMAPQLHQRPPFRAEHLGSLLRPHNLLDTKLAYEAGKTTEAELTAVEDKEVNDIIKTQQKLGYAAISDGEYRRHSKHLAHLADGHC